MHAEEAAEILARQAYTAALPPPPIRVPKNLQPEPYVLPETPPVHSKIALFHGINLTTMFTVPDNIEIILFSGRGKFLSIQSVEMIFKWITTFRKLDTHDLSIYDGIEYDGAHFKGAFPGGNNTPPPPYIKLRTSRANFRIKVLKSGQRCPNIGLEIGDIEKFKTGSEPTGIYEPTLADFKVTNDILDGYSGRDIPLTYKIINETGPQFFLENLVSLFTTEYPGEKVRIYMLCCRSGDLVPPNAGNLTPNVTRTMNYGLPNLRGGKRKNKKRQTTRRRKYTH
jgi:hypothetical protein